MQTGGRGREQLGYESFGSFTVLFFNAYKDGASRTTYKRSIKPLSQQNMIISLSFLEFSLFRKSNFWLRCLELKNQRYIKQNIHVPLSYLSGLFYFMGIFPLYSGHSVLFQFSMLIDRSDAIPCKLLSLRDTHILKGLSHEIDFTNFDKNWQIMASIRAGTRFLIFRRLLWF